MASEEQRVERYGKRTAKKGRERRTCGEELSDHGGTDRQTALFRTPAVPASCQAREGSCIHVLRERPHAVGAIGGCDETLRGK